MVSVYKTSILISGGCANFGHSCYGGMGKRALDIASSNDEFVADMPYAQDAGLVFTGPRSGGYNSYPRERMSPQQYEQLSRILKQWIQFHKSPQSYQRDENMV
ncbi:hypothetical protein WA026_013864 [Henosepilachna vigintioctopunctata]|uniref:Uncharacterized protein n=1 Tax=Henosepilachna vigintioctopunctata TaxID=420089 RepID=A0AAW1U1S6_9CUCU